MAYVRKKVKDSHHTHLCDKCELWFPIECLEFPVYNYSTLLNLTGFGFAQTADTPIIYIIAENTRDAVEDEEK